ncbi:hypothetical protein FOM00_09825 [Pseudomonas sp. ST1]|nr:hypothetical protein FOM00_09825 [Pseudomonas sp. ST1]
MGRGASRTACDAERRTIVFPRARQLQNDRSSRSAWECRSRRSASSIPSVSALGL